jgi:hypothetical protein
LDWWWNCHNDGESSRFWQKLVIKFLLKSLSIQTYTKINLLKSIYSNLIFIIIKSYTLINIAWYKW